MWFSQISAKTSSKRKKTEKKKRNEKEHKQNNLASAYFPKTFASNRARFSNKTKQVLYEVYTLQETTSFRELAVRHLKRTLQK